MDSEADKVYAAEDAKMRFMSRLDDLRAKYQGNPGQQEALTSFGGQDPIEGLKIFDALDAAGLTPWDVYKIYGPMWKLQSEKGWDQKNLEMKILGSSGYPKKGDLMKVVSYVIEEKSIKKPEASALKKDEPSLEQKKNGEHFFTTFILNNQEFTDAEKNEIHEIVLSKIGGWSVENFVTGITRKDQQVDIKCQSGVTCYLYLKV